MKKWIAVAAVVALGVVALGFVAHAQEEGMRRAEFRFSGEGFAGGRGFHGREHMGARLLALLDNPRVKESLGLTDDQTTRLRQIVVDAEKSSIKTGADMAVRGVELRELLRADHPDRQAVMKEADGISALRAQMMKQHLDSLLAAKSVLTPEQQQKIRSFIENRGNREGMRDRFFYRRAPHPGQEPGGPPHAPPPPTAPNP